MGSSSRQDRPSTVPVSVVHDLQNLLTAIASETVRAREVALSVAPAPGGDALHASIRELGSRVGQAIALLRASAPTPRSRGLGALALWLEQHASALGGLVGAPSHVRVVVMEGAADMRVRVDETDLLRALIDATRILGMGTDGLDLELGVAQISRPIDAVPRSIAPSRYAVIRFPVGPRSEAALASVARLLGQYGGGVRMEAGSVELFLPAEVADPAAYGGA